MASWPILSVTTFLPIVGVLFIALMRNDDAGNRNIRWIALWTTIVTFGVSLIMLWRFDAGSPEFQFVEKREWLGGFATYRMGVDGISLPFVILTTALMPLASQFAFSTNWKSALAASKRQTRISDTANVTSVVHSAIQRELRRAASSSPRLT